MEQSKMVSRVYVESATILEVAGEIDVKNVEDLNRELYEVSRIKPKMIVLDLCNVEYIDSAGLGALLAFHKRMADTGAKIALVASEPIAQILKQTRLDLLFNSKPSKREAIISVSG